MPISARVYIVSQGDKTAFEQACFWKSVKVLKVLVAAGVAKKTDCVTVVWN